MHEGELLSKQREGPGGGCGKSGPREAQCAGGGWRGRRGRVPDSALPTLRILPRVSRKMLQKF